jgi:hypothetical protein
MCVVVLESRINASLNGYPCWLALNAAFIVLSSGLATSRLSSQSAGVSGVCDVLK